MEKKHKVIAVCVLRGEPLYKCTNERLLLAEYYLRNPDEFILEEFSQNMSTEFRKLSLQGKLKKHRQVHQWIKTFEFLETILDIEYIIGKEIDIDELNYTYKSQPILQVLVDNYKEAFEIIGKGECTAEDDLRIKEIDEEVELYTKLLEDVKTYAKKERSK